MESDSLNQHPPSFPPPPQYPDQTPNHLQLLSTFHYVLGGITAVAALFPVIHLVVGLFLLFSDSDIQVNDNEAKFVGAIFVSMASVFILLGETLAMLIIIAGRRLARRTNYTYCMIIGGISCIFAPIGTALGVFTIIVLSRPQAQELFGRKVRL